MLAWLPSIISVLIGILGQVNAADWVAAHPNVAMALGTLGALITALTKSPLNNSAPPPTINNRKHYLFVLPFILLSCAGPAYALTATVEGTQVRLGYQEPTHNKTGTPLSDLAKTSTYYAIPPGSTPHLCGEIPASSATGGGTIEAVCLVPVMQDQEADVRFTVTVSDLVGNESEHSVPVDTRLDFLAPAPPR